MAKEITFNAEELLTLQRALGHSIEHLSRASDKKNTDISMTFGLMFTQEKIARLYAKIFPEAISRNSKSRS